MLSRVPDPHLVEIWSASRDIGLEESAPHLELGGGLVHAAEGTERGQ